MATPRTDAERLAWLRLSRSRNVGARAFQSLIGRYGGAGAALNALPELAARGGEKALATMCIGVGQGVAMALASVS